MSTEKSMKDAKDYRVRKIKAVREYLDDLITESALYNEYIATNDAEVKTKWLLAFQMMRSSALKISQVKSSNAAPPF